MLEKNFLPVFIIFTLSTFDLYAQSVEELRLKNPSKYNFLNDLTWDTNAQKFDAIDNSRGLTYTFGLKYKIDGKSNLWGFAQFSKRFNGEERFDMLDSVLRYERTLGSLYDFSNRTRLSLILPTNEFNHELTSFVGALSAQMRSGKSLNNKFYLNLINTLRWNFHNYRVSEQASPNIQALFSSSASISYTPLEKLTLSGSLGWRFAKSYKNIVTDRYSFDLSASYSLPKKLTLTLGAGTQGSPYTANGQSSNIRIFDERNTSYYISLSHFY